MKTVEFTKPWQIYSRGDVAGFEPGLAQKLIDGHVAKAHEPEAEPEAKPAKAAK